MKQESILRLQNMKKTGAEYGLCALFDLFLLCGAFATVLFHSFYDAPSFP